MTSTPIDIKYYKDDAEGFKEIINHLVAGLLELYHPNEVSIVRIKNWFDHKWLNYSGKKIELYDKNNHPHIPFVLEPFWNNSITVPPFNPNRVLSESYYKISEVENQKFKEIFHFEQHSTENRNNSISEKTDNGLCLWISTNSVQNRQGSLMTYRILNNEVESWYASIQEDGLWQINKTKGISKNRVLIMLTELNEKYKSN